jgi:hypothetical protein
MASIAPFGDYQSVVAMHYDHGGLDIKILEDEKLRIQRREIFHDFKDDRGYEELINGPEDDDYVDNYYAFDDDFKRNPLLAWDDQEIHKTKQCRRTSWHRDLPINCNNLHEFDLEHRFRFGGTKFLRCVLFYCAVLGRSIDTLQL